MTRLNKPVKSSPTKSSSVPTAGLSSELLLVQTAFVGDLLLSIPLLKEMRSLEPASKITLVCRKGLGEFMLKAGLVDESCEIEKGGADDQATWRAARQKLARRRFSLIFCPHESFRSARFVFGLNSRRKIGYKRFFNSVIFTDRIQRPMHLPEALRQLALLGPLSDGWRTRLREYEEQTQRGGLLEKGQLAPVPRWAEMSIPRLFQLKKEFSEAAALSSATASALVDKWALSPRKKIAILAPGSVWPTKMWSLDGYTRVARELLQEGWQVFALGAQTEVDICEELVRRAPGVVSVAGATRLWESTELIALAQLVICNDSGAMHMAAAAATPTVSIFGPTVLSFGYRPWQHRARVVQVDLECRPCGKHGSRVCPLGTHACMKKVSPEAVFESTRSLVPSK